MTPQSLVVFAEALRVLTALLPDLDRELRCVDSTKGECFGIWLFWLGQAALRSLLFVGFLTELANFDSIRFASVCALRSSRCCGGTFCSFAMRSLCHEGLI
jgi:hypothetical protein